jgi:hypothetical protein
MKYFMQDEVKDYPGQHQYLRCGKVDSKDGAIAEGGIFV